VTELGPGREFDLIKKFLAHASRRDHPLVRVGPGDDASVIGDIAISSDMSVEGVHFRRDWLAAGEIGYRATVAALSDLAAVAAKPVAAMVSLAVRPGDAEEWAADLMQGCTEAIEQYGALLAGGDLTRAVDSAVIDVIVIGEAEQPVLRSGARIGDEVWVTGTLGGAAAAVAAWLDNKTPAAPARARYARPAARISEALWLKPHVHAMIDLSDGIAGDAGHIAAASGCRLDIDAERLPVHSTADTRLALQGGEDYELCVTAAAGVLDTLRTEFEQRFNTELTRVGDVVDGDGVVIRNFDGEGGYDHFARATP